MIDDLKYIHNTDKSDALGVAEKQPSQLLEKFQININKIEANNIVLAGMGGSALAAAITSSWPGHDTPFEIIRGYSVPNYVNQKTLFIASSYSGNTEETLAALQEAEKKQAQIAVIASGGQLVEIASQKGYPLAKLPGSLQPRYAVFYALKALITLLNSAELINNHSALEDLEKATDFVNTSVKSWLPTVPTKNNLAKQIAKEVIGKSAVIYAGPLLGPAAYKWKISFNENAKLVAWCNQFPEFNHNEFIGWSKSQPISPMQSLIFDLILKAPELTRDLKCLKGCFLVSGRHP